MSLSLVGIATGTNTVTVPTTQAGDLVIFAAYRNTTGTPSLPSGAIPINLKVGTTSSMRLGYKIATGASTTSGTWTNATAMVCHVYRSSNIANGSSVSIGASATSSATTNTVNYPALTLYRNDNTSWVAGFAGTSNTSQTIASAPAGMTNESHETATATQCAGHDTEGTVSSWSSTNVTTTGTAGNSVSATVEITETAAINTSTFYWCNAYFGQGNNASAANNATNNYQITCPAPALSGNARLLVLDWFNNPSAITISSISDNVNGSWNLAATGSGGTLAGSVTGANNTTSIYVLPNNSSGTTTITIVFSSIVQGPIINVMEVPGVSTLSPVNGFHGAADQAGTTTNGYLVSAGSFTPGNNNANGGNIIFVFAMNSNGAQSGSHPQACNPNNNLFLMNGDIGGTDNAGNPKASAYGVQATSAAINPGIAMLGDTDIFNVVAVALALSPGAGTQPSGARVHSVTEFFLTTMIANWQLLLPIYGGTSVFTNDSSTQFTAIKDIAGNTYTFISADTASPTTSAASQHWWNPTITPGSTYLINVTGNPPQITAGLKAQCKIYDLAGVKNTLGANAWTTGTSSGTVLSNVMSLTPTQIGSIQICTAITGNGPVSSVFSPSGAFFSGLKYYFEGDADTYNIGDLQAICYTTALVTQNWSLTIGSPVAAAASWTTSSTTITVAQSFPASSIPTGLNVYDATTQQSIGTSAAGSGFYSGTTITLTATASNGGSNGDLLSLENQTGGSGLAGGHVTEFLPSAAAFVPVWAWQPRVNDERLLPISRLPDQFFPWFLPSKIPVPQLWLPTTGQEDRPPPPSRRPDDSSIENRRWFTRSLNPLPTNLQPTTGQEDRPPPASRRPDDSSIENPQWFLQSQSPVPQNWPPTAGEQDHPPVIRRPPDEPTGWFLKAVIVTTTPSRWLPTTGEDVEHPIPPKRTDWPPQWFAPPVPYPQIWLPTTGKDVEHPVSPPRTDWAPQWFVQSPSPIVVVWLPTAGEAEHPIPPLRNDWTPTWFYPSQIPVLQTWLPTTGQEDRPPAQKRPPDEPGTFFFPFTTAGISGIAWWRQTEVYLEPMPSYRDYKLSWDPQFIVQIAPTFVEIYANELLWPIGARAIVKRNP